MYIVSIYLPKLTFNKYATHTNTAHTATGFPKGVRFMSVYLYQHCMSLGVKQGQALPEEKKEFSRNSSHHKYKQSFQSNAPSPGLRTHGYITASHLYATYNITVPNLIFVGLACCDDDTWVWLSLVCVYFILFYFIRRGTVPWVKWGNFKRKPRLVKSPEGTEVHWRRTHMGAQCMSFPKSTHTQL